MAFRFFLQLHSLGRVQDVQPIDRVDQGLDGGLDDVRADAPAGGDDIARPQLSMLLVPTSTPSSTKGYNPAVS